MNSVPQGRVFVSDGSSRAGLAVVRSLGQQDLQVTAGSDQPFAMAFASKFCFGRLVYPSPGSSPEGFLSCLLQHLGNQDYDCLIPTMDLTIKLVVRHRDRFAEVANVLVVDQETLDLAMDKGRTVKFAEAHGFTHPRTFFIEDLQDLAVVRDELAYPAVIKPRVSWGARGIVFVTRPEDFLASYHRVHRRYPFPLIQEAIPPTSPKFGVQCLFNREGKLRAAVVQRFWRQFPLLGGEGSCFETVNRPDIQATGVRLLEKLGWRGVAQVEFLEDERDGNLKLMEINPRFWNSLQTVIQAGVDFPYLLYQIATQGDVEPQLNYRIGEVCRAMPGEIRYLFAKHSWRSGGPPFWRFFGSTLGYCILNRHDVRPVFAYIWITLRRIVRQTLTRR